MTRKQLPLWEQSCDDGIDYRGIDTVYEKTDPPPSPIGQHLFHGSRELKASGKPAAWACRVYGGWKVYVPGTPDFFILHDAEEDSDEASARCRTAG